MDWDKKKSRTSLNEIIIYLVVNSLLFNIEHINE
jgi:hypothetical protein